jgi:hypothetical protein
MGSKAHILRLRLRMTGLSRPNAEKSPGPARAQTGDPVVQNKPNLRRAKINVSLFYRKDYGNLPAFGAKKNKPKQSQLQSVGIFGLERAVSAVKVAPHSPAGLDPRGEDRLKWHG